jgi:hypothetical protein
MKLEIGKTYITLTDLDYYQSLQLKGTIVKYIGAEQGSEYRPTFHVFEFPDGSERYIGDTEADMNQEVQEY